jgi:cell division protein FtsB
LQQEEQISLKQFKFEQEHKGLLENRLQYLSVNDYIEALARTRLCLVKKGEIAYKIF